MRLRAIALMGPTAAGKSACALELAQRLDGEIVSVDSALVYRRLDIGSAKPTPAEQAQVRHHMLDLREPWQTYSAAEFARDARAAIEAIAARGKWPILVGGTGLYFRALLEGLSAMPSADPAVRAQLAEEAARHGWPALHAQLALVDPMAAARIHVSDTQRIQRALEVYRSSGKPISAWQRAERTGEPWLDACTLALAPAQRAQLHVRIEARFDAMLEAGFLAEVRALRALPALAAHPAPRQLPALRAVGYRQAWEFLDGLGDAADFRTRAIAATRQLAKRQYTWLRGTPDVAWFDPHTQRTQIDAAVDAFVAGHKHPSMR